MYADDMQNTKQTWGMALVKQNWELNHTDIWRNIQIHCHPRKWYLPKKLSWNIKRWKKETNNTIISKAKIFSPGKTVGYTKKTHKPIKCFVWKTIRIRCIRYGKQFPTINSATQIINMLRYTHTHNIPSLPVFSQVSLLQRSLRQRTSRHGQWGIFAQLKLTFCYCTVVSTETENNLASHVNNVDVFDKDQTMTRT